MRAIQERDVRPLQRAVLVKAVKILPPPPRPCEVIEDSPAKATAALASRAHSRLPSLLAG
eukprot:m.46352 g.46352  ORF g.46352 m.46352 type:complete len:60 (+) comp12239_c0_seq5:633-812(+)